MYYPEEIAALVLTAILGLGFVLRPAVIYNYGIYLFHTGDTGRGGRWGGDPEPAGRTLTVIRLVGVLILLVAVAVAAAPWWRDAVF